jgi:hypothetical protein
VRGGALVSALGLGAALALPEPGPALAGFAAMGIGLSVLFPLTLRAAGLQGGAAGPALASGPALAAVSTVGYVGFLAGPPLIGSLADASSLRAALVLVCGLCVVAALAARRARLG